MNTKNQNKIKLPKFDESLFYGERVGNEPEDIIDEVGIKRGDFVADFGAGSGHFALALSNIVGDTGKIVAIDINQELLLEIKQRAEEEGVKNIYCVKGNLEEPGSSKLKDETVDFVIIMNLMYLIKKEKR